MQTEESSHAVASRKRCKLFRVEEAEVRIYEHKTLLGIEAAKHAASVIRDIIARRDWARVIAATGNSQLEFISALTREQIDWNRVELFHMDEYAGMSETHPASFRRWIRERLVNQVYPARVHYLAGDAPEMEKEMERYSALLAGPIDLAFVGFGENGHIAFNDPPVADFADSRLIKRVTLDQACRQQQFNEGHFPALEVVPTEAITLTCPALMRADTWICCVPDRRKAMAVQCALEGPVSTGCPASLVRTHQNSFVYLDRESASLLSGH